MINKLVLNNFKIHNRLELPLKGLTLLTGANGMGKSSVIQSLLLLRQSCEKLQPIEGLDLKGDLCELGFRNDVLCQSSSSNTLDIELLTDDDDLKFSFDCDSASSTDTMINAVDPNNPDSQKISKCSLFTDDFQYASAFRLGPQSSYERDTKIVQIHKQISKKDGQCEFVVHYLYQWGDKIICPKPMCIIEDDDDDNEIYYTLKEQVHRWMQFISSKIDVKIEPFGNGFKLNYNFAVEGNAMTSNISAINVGYGVSYVLPILVAILSAKPGALILIENPEAHIHPRAQAELMKLIARAVKSGIQIIIETHSDHIINGALVQVAMENQEGKTEDLFKDKVKVYYFERNDQEHSSIVTSLNIQEDGRIVAQDQEGNKSKLPNGFFDQINIDMRTIMGLRKLR